MNNSPQPPQGLAPMTAKTIWAFPLSIVDQQQIVLPTDYTILSVQMQDGQPRLWALVDPLASTTSIVIDCPKAGHPIASVGTFIGAIQYNSLVYHFFIRNNKEY